MLFMLLLPTAQAAEPAARWGQQAVFVESSSQMYVVGGASSNDVTEVTNDVYILDLKDGASWSDGPNSGLPAHAFAAMAYSQDKLTVAGGMTSSCSSDAPIHTFDLSGKTWSSESPRGFVRRHGSAAASTANGTMIVGGLVDKYVCASGTSGYAAMDMLSSSGDSFKATGLPKDLTGNSCAVSDFAMVAANDKVYLAGGQDINGKLVPLNTIAIWENGSWKAQATSGETPAGRLGGSLVAHPTLDLLVLFGGSTQVSSDYFVASSVVSLLNTTTWAWSMPRNLQPSRDAAVAYHSAVMTPAGVMISSFGRGRLGYPTNAVNYLDMRDPSGSTWSWSSEWSNEMLTTYTPPAATTQGSQKAAKSSNKGTIAAAVVPTVICVLILIPIVVWLVRRHLRSSRKRRLASHFSFSTQEDRGDFSRPNRYPFYAFGGDNSSSESSINSLSKRVMTVFRRGTKGVGDDGTINEGERQMTQVAPAQLTEKGNNWEEIDFGLGRVDAQRRDGHYTDLPVRSRTPRRSSPGEQRIMDPRLMDDRPIQRIPFPMPIASTISYPDEEPISPTRQSPVLGQLVDTDSPRLGSPLSDGQVPLVPSDNVVADAGADAAMTDANDWNMLEQEMMSRPAFQASPNSTLRSHTHASISHASHTHASSQTVHAPVSPTSRGRSTPSPTPSLPPLEFDNTPFAPRIPSGRHLAGGRRSTVSRGSGHRASQGSINTLGLTRSPRSLHVANPSDQ